MKARRDDMQESVWEVDEERVIQQIRVDGLKKLLGRTQSALKGTEECVFQRTDEVMVAFVTHFEEAKTHAALLYPYLDLSPLCPFKVVLNMELVDEE